MRVASAELIASCKRHEGGPALVAYPDPDSPQAVAKREGKPWQHLSGNPWTIAYGRTSGVHQGMTCTVAEADAWVTTDCQTATNEIVQHLPWSSKLAPARFDVLAEMAFNLGIAGLLTFHRSLTYVEDGQFVLAVTSLKLTEWAKQVGHRATDLENQLVSGRYA